MHCGVWTQSAPDGEDRSFGKYGLMNPFDDKYLELEDGGRIWVFDVHMSEREEVAGAAAGRGGVKDC